MLSFCTAEPDVADNPAYDVNEIARNKWGRSPPTFSILIGRASTEDRARILETLDALRAQKASPTYEVIIADRLCDSITEVLCVDYPEAQVICCATGTSLP